MNSRMTDSLPFIRSWMIDNLYNNTGTPKQHTNSLSVYENSSQKKDWKPQTINRNTNIIDETALTAVKASEGSPVKYIEESRPQSILGNSFLDHLDILSLRLLIAAVLDLLESPVFRFPLFGRNTRN